MVIEYLVKPAYGRQELRRATESVKPQGGDQQPRLYLNRGKQGSWNEKWEEMGVNFNHSKCLTCNADVSVSIDRFYRTSFLSLSRSMS